MAFSIREFTKKGIMDSIGKLPDYKVVENAMQWFAKGVLQQDDVADIQTAMERHNNNKTIVGDMVK